MRRVSLILQLIEAGNNEFYSRWDVTGPESEVVGVNHGKLMVQIGNVVDQAQILNRVQVWHGRREDMQGREREDTGNLPLSDSCLDLGRPHEIRLVGGG